MAGAWHHSATLRRGRAAAASRDAMVTQPETEGILLLEDGSQFVGRLAAPGRRFGEVVFNTSMTGYQEILTDPSYRGRSW
jgi:hypothetical protein